MEWDDDQWDQDFEDDDIDDDDMGFQGDEREDKGDKSSGQDTISTVQIYFKSNQQYFIHWLCEKVTEEVYLYMMLIIFEVSQSGDTSWL